MKLYFLKFWLIISILCSTFSAFAYDFEVEGIYYNILSDSSVEVTYGDKQYNSDTGDFVIPSEISHNGSLYSVKRIGSNAFYRCSRLKSIAIPNSVKSIGSGAFRDCDRLTKAEFASIEHLCSISFSDSYSNPLNESHNLYINGEEITNLVIPSSVTSIGNYAFYNCTGLKSITIPSSIKSIGSHAFSGCWGLIKAEFASIEHLCSIDFSDSSSNPLCESRNLYINGEKITNLVIPNSVTSIGNYAFYNCTSLTSISIGNSVTSIGSHAFYYCTGLTSISIGNSVTSIGSHAFYSCTGLTSVIIPDSVLEIGEQAFWDCSSLTSATIGNSVTSIGSCAFYHCSGLTSIIIPDSVLEIGEIAFCGCRSLKSAIIGNSVTSIGSSAFENCTGLTSVIIPNSVSSIGSRAFSDCTSLTSIHVKALVPPTITKDTFDGLYESAVVTIPREAAVWYLAPDWNRFKNFRPSGCDKLISSASDGLLNYYLIPAAENDDKNLAIVKAGNYSGEITIPERFTYTDSEGNNTRYYLTGIGYQAFKNSKITKVNFNSRIDLKAIGEEAFQRCTELTELNIPESVTSIGKSAFQGCTELTELNIPESVTSIGKSAFQGCTELTELNIPESVTSIGKSAFRNCYDLNSVTLNNTITTVPDSCFMGLKRLTTLKLGSQVTKIGASAFSDCSDLTEVVLPPLVETIGESAFDGCSNLSTIILGANVKTIGNKAFNKTKAENVYITSLTPPVAPYSTFSNYSGKLHLQNQAAKAAYYDALTCWDRFDSEIMVVPTKLHINKTELNSELGESIQLTATLEPANVTLPQVFWGSDNPEAATVDVNGLVTIYDNNYKIIVETLYANGPSLELTSNDSTPAESVTLSQTTASLKVGESIALIATVKPDDATDKTVVWTSSNEAIASVDFNGNVTAIALGEVVITAKCGDVSATCTVSVVPIMVETITLTPEVWSGVEGETIQLAAIVLPDNATDKSLTWSSSDITVATVNTNGLVTILKDGNCVITATAADGSGITAQCRITGLSGIEEILANGDATVDVYTTSGVLLKKGCTKTQLQQLTPGIYIVKMSLSTITKLLVK